MKYPSPSNPGTCCQQTASRSRYGSDQARTIAIGRTGSRGLGDLLRDREPRVACRRFLRPGSTVTFVAAGLERRTRPVNNAFLGRVDFKESGVVGSRLCEDAPLFRSSAGGRSPCSGAWRARMHCDRGSWCRPAQPRPSILKLSHPPFLLTISPEYHAGSRHTVRQGRSHCPTRFLAEKMPWIPETLRSRRLCRALIVPRLAE